MNLFIKRLGYVFSTELNTIIDMSNELKRCFWVSSAPLYQQYHDQEWGVFCIDEQSLFEQFCLEGQQAGLSWWTVLQKREQYRHHYFQFSIAQIAQFSDKHIEECILIDAGVIRHKNKLLTIRNNAILWLKYNEDLRSQNRVNSLTPMVNYLWSFAFYTQTEIFKQISLKQQEKLQLLTVDQLRSWYMSYQLKKMGFKFVGHQICHAFMQAIGMFNHHDQNCFCIDRVTEQNKILISKYF